MASNSAQSQRQRRYRRHKSGEHSECLPDRECRREGATNSRIPAGGSPPPRIAAPSLSPREAIEREIGRTIARLDVLDAALVDRPLDVEILAETRGQQRNLASLTAALARFGPVAPVVPINESPLDRLRRVREERLARRSPLDEIVEEHEERKAGRLEELQRRRAEQRGALP